MILNELWFLILGILLAGYAILDGFDLGVGILHLMGKTEEERRVFMGAIGPLWDGNEVWLVTFGGATFAAFPEAYATVFSGFYAVFMMVLLGLIGRAVSLEFRGKVHAPLWRSTWDAVFSLSSFIVSFLFGIGVGNAMIGIPLDLRGISLGGFVEQFRPYPLLVGFLTVAMFSMHGAVFLFLKMTGVLQERVRRWALRSFFLFLVIYLLVTVLTISEIPGPLEKLRAYPWVWGGFLFHVVIIGQLYRALRKGNGWSAFFCSSMTIAGLVFLFGFAIFPNLVTSAPHPENSLTLFNAASSPKTLKILTLMAAIGMPFVMAYTAIVYRVFHGKVDPDKTGYEP